jgi:hypothetical protein
MIHSKITQTKAGDKPGANQRKQGLTTTPCCWTTAQQESPRRCTPPNKTLRPSAFKLINDIHERTVKECGLVVSCADIIPLTARDAARLVRVVCLPHLNDEVLRIN